MGCRVNEKGLVESPALIALVIVTTGIIKQLLTVLIMLKCDASLGSYARAH